MASTPPILDPQHPDQIIPPHLPFPCRIALPRLGEWVIVFAEKMEGAEVKYPVSGLWKTATISCRKESDYTGDVASTIGEWLAIDGARIAPMRFDPTAHRRTPACSCDRDAVEKAKRDRLARQARWAEYSHRRKTNNKTTKKNKHHKPAKSTKPSLYLSKPWRHRCPECTAYDYRVQCWLPLPDRFEAIRNRLCEVCGGLCPVTQMHNSVICKECVEGVGGVEGDKGDEGKLIDSRFRQLTTAMEQAKTIKGVQSAIDRIVELCGGRNYFAHRFVTAMDTEREQFRLRSHQKIVHMEQILRDHQMKMEQVELRQREEELRKLISERNRRAVRLVREADDATAMAVIVDTLRLIFETGIGGAAFRTLWKERGGKSVPAEDREFVEKVVLGKRVVRPVK